MLVFLSCVGLLILGYFTYGLFVERIFGSNGSRPTPASTKNDGIDYVKMPLWKTFFIQLLDIAGVGPIFGPIMAALYGPVALVWIVIGSIFAGGVHDFFSGMMSVRYDGANLPEIIGKTMGKKMRVIALVFSLLLLTFVGVVFVLSPATMLNDITGISVPILVGVIFFYYFAATIAPIDKIIGRLYPVFGALLLFMTFGIFIGMAAGGYKMLPDLSLHNAHPDKLPIWPLMFITLSCGAISGFHSTQSPLMARCITNEKHGRPVFYGAMIAEGIIALVWATAGLSLYEPAQLAAIINSGTPALVVSETSIKLLGHWIGVLAILGVIILPITSGDTAFRSARLIIAEFVKLPQKKISNRLLIALPLFVIGFIISRLHFNIIWRYFGWSNQTLATLILWSSAVYLVKAEKPHWIASIPAFFLTAVVTAFICYSKIGFSMSYPVSVTLGLILATGTTAGFIAWTRLRQRSTTRL